MSLAKREKVIEYAKQAYTNVTVNVCENGSSCPGVIDLWHNTVVSRQPDSRHWLRQELHSWEHVSRSQISYVVDYGIYHQSRCSFSVIISRVKDRPSNDVPFRPHLGSLVTTSKLVIDVIRDCWQEEPTHRPDFKTVRNRLKPITKGM